MPRHRKIHPLEGVADVPSLIASEVVSGMVRKTGISVNEALHTIWPCGKHQGEPMSQINYLSLKWIEKFNHESEKTSPEFKKAILAARVLLAVGKQRKIERETRERFNRGESDAVFAIVECRDCHHQYRMRRHRLGRRGDYCPRCGGHYDEVGGPVDTAWVSLTAAAAALGCTTNHVRKMVGANELAARIHQNRMQISQSSINNEKARRQEVTHMEYINPDYSAYVFCGLCKKRFRNPAALKLHMEEVHEEF